MSENYATIKLPTKFVEESIDPHVNDTSGYSSRAEFIKAAVRDFVKLGAEAIKAKRNVM